MLPIQRVIFDELTLERAKDFDQKRPWLVASALVDSTGTGGVSGAACVLNCSSSTLAAWAICHCCETETCQRLRPRLRLSIWPNCSVVSYSSVPSKSQRADTDDGLPFTVFSQPSEHTCKCLCVFPLRYCLRIVEIV